MKKALIAVLVFATWLVLGNQIGTYLDNRGYEIVNHQQPASRLHSLDQFGVLVVSPSYPAKTYEAHVVSYSASADYVKRHLDCCRTIPDGNDDELNRKMADGDDCDYGVTGFTVKRRPDGTQLISLVSKDGLVRYYYEANSLSVKPISFSAGVARGRDSYYAAGAILAVPATAALCLGIWGCAVLLKRALMRWG